MAWQCAACTFIHDENYEASICAICHTPKHNVASPIITADEKIVIPNPTNWIRYDSFVAMMDETVKVLFEGTDGDLGTLDQSKFIKSDDSNAVLVGNKQYGRVLPPLVNQIIEFTNLQSNETFIDAGSGCGQVVLQVAATVGCKAIGIEVVAGRHFVAEQLRESFIDTAKNHIETLIGVNEPPIEISDINEIFDESRCQLLNESFVEKEGVKYLMGADVLFANNAEGIFSSQRNEKGGTDLDAELAKLVRSLKVGARIVTLDKLPELGQLSFPLKPGENFDCSKHHSPFTLETFKSAPGTCSWKSSNLEQDIYLYTKRGTAWMCPCCGYRNDINTMECMAREWGGLNGEPFCQGSIRALRCSAKNRRKYDKTTTFTDSFETKTKRRSVGASSSSSSSSPEISLTVPSKNRLCQSTRRREHCHYDSEEQDEELN